MDKKIELYGLTAGKLKKWLEQVPDDYEILEHVSGQYLVAEPWTEPMTLSPDQIARVVHEANRALQIELEDATISPPWDDLDEETRRSAVNGVEGVILGNTPAESHERWMQFKLAHGWVYGPRDDDAKTHPLLVPYGELDKNARRKDHLFAAIVRALTQEV